MCVRERAFGYSVHSMVQVSIGKRTSAGERQGERDRERERARAREKERERDRERKRERVCVCERERGLTDTRSTPRPTWGRRARIGPGMDGGLIKSIHECWVDPKKIDTRIQQARNCGGIDGEHIAVFLRQVFTFFSYGAMPMLGSSSDILIYDG